MTNNDDIIDSRDIIERLAELEAKEERDEEEDEELKVLLALREEAGGSGDWEFGATLIRDSHFRDYAQELAEEIGAIDPDANWPINCIDWERAANELKVDYADVDFDGVTYWVRS